MSAACIPLPASISARLAALGIDSHAVAIRAGFPSDFTQRPGLDTRQFFAVWYAIAELTGDPLVGLRVGSEAAPGQNW